MPTDLELIACAEDAEPLLRYQGLRGIGLDPQLDLVSLLMTDLSGSRIESLGRHNSDICAAICLLELIKRSIPPPFRVSDLEAPIRSRDVENYY